MVRILEPTFQPIDHSEQKEHTVSENDYKQALLECIELIDDCSDGSYSIK